LADDADFFHDKIEDLVSAGKDVVVVAHSYGGMVATDAAQGLSTAARADQGLAGGVSRIVYLASIVAEVGETAGELTANLKFDFMKPVEVC
jgi:pimeloyl-ACP methyl ester carboxylesterase